MYPSRLAEQPYLSQLARGIWEPDMLINSTGYRAIS